MHFLLIWKNEFIHELKRDGIESMLQWGKGFGGKRGVWQFVFNASSIEWRRNQCVLLAKNLMKWLQKIYISKQKYSQNALHKTLQWTRCISPSEAKFKESQIIKESFNYIRKILMITAQKGHLFATHEKIIPKHHQEKKLWQ